MPHTYRINNPKYLLEHWPLNNNAKAAIRGNDGTWVGTPDYDEGPFGRSVGKFASGTYISCGTNDSLNLTTGTISCLVKFDTVAVIAYIVARRGTTGSNGWNLLLNNGVLTVVDGGTTIRSFGYSVVAGRWYHIVCGFSGADIKLYIDGDYAANAAASAAFASASGVDTRIGNRDGGSAGFIGQVGDFKIHNVDLTGDEILALYNQDRRL